MSVEVWWRNPAKYVRDCVELVSVNLVFDAGFVAWKRVDPVNFADLFIPASLPYRILIIDREKTVEVRRDYGINDPYATYPTWDFDVDSIGILEELCECPVGGQEHRIVLRKLPAYTTPAGRHFVQAVREIQDDNPEAILHVNGLDSFRLMFDGGFQSVDYCPQADRLNQTQIALPNGRQIKPSEAKRYTQWIRLLGMKPAELEAPAKRSLYNMKSALWAAQHWRDEVAFDIKKKAIVDPDAIEHVPNTVEPRGKTGIVGDKVTCDTCSLAPTCKFFRAGEVCTLPGSETVTLSKLFLSRDPDKIIDGLGTLMDVSSRRLERALNDEESMGGKDGPLDPEVTKLVNSAFRNGTSLAKLLAPQRFTSGLKVILPGVTPIEASPQQVVAEVVRELRSAGVPEGEITPELIEKVVGRMQAIDAAPIED